MNTQKQTPRQSFGLISLLWIHLALLIVPCCYHTDLAGSGRCPLPTWTPVLRGSVTSIVEVRSEDDPMKLRPLLLPDHTHCQWAKGSQ